VVPDIRKNEDLYARLLAPFRLSPLENHRKEANDYEGRSSKQEDFGQRQGSFYRSVCSQRKLTCTVRVEGKKFSMGVFRVNTMLCESFLVSSRSQIKVAYEVGPCGFWLDDRLTEDGIETIIVPPSLIPIESGNKVETDKRDSRKFDKVLRKPSAEEGLCPFGGRQCRQRIIGDSASGFRASKWITSSRMG